VPDAREDDPGARLEARLATELCLPASAGAHLVAHELCRRHGDSVDAILFYGSCLRKRTPDGVLDFYVLVDSYDRAFRSRLTAVVAALLPPSVLYCEVSGPAGTLRAKYAVISRRDFLRRAGPRSLDTRVWARFCQPAALVHARDEGARDAVVEAVARACRTFVERMTLVLAAEAEHRFDAATLWQEGFHETYRAELRGESPQTVRMLYESAPARYEGVARDVLQELDGRGRIRLRQAEDGSLRVVVPPGVRRWARASWALRRRVAKSIAILGLLKTAWTFGDWVPYVLWKIERHTGVRLEVSERQRRHPLIFGWPVIYRVLRRGLLR